MDKNVIEVLKESVKLGNNFYENAVTKAVSEYFSIKIKFYSKEKMLKRIEKLLKKVSKIEEIRGDVLKFDNVSSKAFVNLIDSYLEEDDEYIQLLYAALLANSSSYKKDIEINYIETIRKFSSKSAQIFNKIYSETVFEEDKHKKIITSNLPDKIIIKDNFDDSKEEPKEDIEEILSNLYMLGCLNPTKSHGGGESFKAINLTTYGYNLYKACAFENSYIHE